MSTPEFPVSTVADAYASAALPNVPVALPDVQPLPNAPVLPVQTLVPLHRLADARCAQNISRAHAAKRLGCSIATVEEEEHPTYDMLLSRLRRWQKALCVPMAELLLDPEDYPDNPIRRRSQLVRVMKTVKTILEKTHETSVKILAQTLCDQLIEIMPELEHIGAWPSVGHSREAKDLGQAAYRRFESGVSRACDE